jgi:hypothetical protein
VETKKKRVNIWILTPKGWRHYGNLRKSWLSLDFGTYSIRNGVITIHLIGVNLHASVFYIEERI